MTYLNALLSFYCHLASQLDPEPSKRVIAFRFSSTIKELYFFLVRIKIKK